MEDIAARFDEAFEWIIAIGLFAAVWALDRLRRQLAELYYSLESIREDVARMTDRACPAEDDEWPPSE